MTTCTGESPCQDCRTERMLAIVMLTCKRRELYNALIYEANFLLELCESVSVEINDLYEAHIHYDNRSKVMSDVLNQLAEKTWENKRWLESTCPNRVATMAAEGIKTT